MYDALIIENLEVGMKIKYIFCFTFLILSSLNYSVFGQSLGKEECTIGVALGSATVDGRPLLWKTRDYSSDPDNKVRYALLKVYPNPANDRIYINCGEKRNLQMQIYNVLDGLVMQRKLKNGTNDIDVSYLSKGIYVI